MKKSLSSQLVIRAFTADDAEDLALYANNPNIARYQRNTFPEPYTKEYAQQWIEHVNNTEEANCFAIASGKGVIGEVGFWVQPDIYSHSAEISYWVGEPFWRKGIASWALGFVMNYAFNDKGIKRLYACITEPNLASKRLLEKSGFVCDGVMRKHIYKHEKFYDELVYSCLADERE